LSQIKAAGADASILGRIQNPPADGRARLLMLETPLGPRAIRKGPRAMVVDQGRTEILVLSLVGKVRCWRRHKKSADFRP
jgi:hypothetical protein